MEMRKSIFCDGQFTSNALRRATGVYRLFCPAKQIAASVVIGLPLCLLYCVCVATAQ